MIAAMRNRRSGVGVIAHSGMLYAIGGFNGITRMNNGEKWDPARNTWIGVAEMYSPRSNFGIEVNTRTYLLMLWRFIDFKSDLLVKMDYRHAYITYSFM